METYTSLFIYNIPEINSIITYYRKCFENVEIIEQINRRNIKKYGDMEIFFLD